MHLVCQMLEACLFPSYRVLKVLNLKTRKVHCGKISFTLAMRNACPQAKPLVNSPFNGIMRGKHKRSAEA